MADAEQQGADEARRGDRRSNDRRKTDRRAPVPPWRRPMALVAYGVLGTLLLFAVVRALGDDEEEPPAIAAGGEVVDAPTPVPVVPSAPMQPAAPERALTTADFERLTIQGDAALGRRVVAQLYCEAPTPVAVQGDTIESMVAAMVDTTGGPRVPAAFCKWGARDDPRRGDFLLLVPPEMAGQFASAPVTMDGYIRRRRLIAEVEWIGKSRALALRTVGVFRGLVPEAQS